MAKLPPDRAPTFVASTIGDKVGMCHIALAQVYAAAYSASRLDAGGLGKTNPETARENAEAAVRAFVALLDSEVA
jgi:hypothetical protein